MFLIEKRGLYYRPKSAGYTGIKREAGRYTFEEAAVHGGPNGPDGSLDGIYIWEEDEAPDFSRSCAWDVKLVEKTRQESADTLSALQEHNRVLREALEYLVPACQVDYDSDWPSGKDPLSIARAALASTNQDTTK